MKIIFLSETYKEDIASILQENFKSYEKREVALEEADELLNDDRICLGILENQELIGVIGSISSYHGYVYELHPLAIKKAHQRKGYGTQLIQSFEKEVKRRGGMTIYLGSDDEYQETSLYNEDLYIDLYDKIQNIKNIKHHPFTFYQKNGYQIVGVVPDANGYGKPDIMMAKRVGEKNADTSEKTK